MIMQYLPNIVAADNFTTPYLYNNKDYKLLALHYYVPDVVAMTVLNLRLLTMIPENGTLISQCLDYSTAFIFTIIGANGSFMIRLIDYPLPRYFAVNFIASAVFSASSGIMVIN